MVKFMIRVLEKEEGISKYGHILLGIGLSFVEILNEIE